MKKVVVGILYYLGQFTWGIIMNIVGLIATLFCLIFLKGKPHKNGYGVITEVKGNWGGVSLGIFALCGSYNQEDKDCYDPLFYYEVRCHEFGHSFQNLIFGPLFLFVVAIPSSIRYWLDEYGKLKKDYFAIWFERDASNWGEHIMAWIESYNYRDYE